MIESFNLLDSDNQGVIDLKTVETLFTTLNTQHTSVGFISPERAELLFAILDGNGDHVVDEEVRRGELIILVVAATYVATISYPF